MPVFFIQIAQILLIAIAIVGTTSCARFDSELPTEDSPILIALGDSITAGETLDKELHYPALLQKRFVTEQINARIYNAGFPGDMSARAEARARELLAFEPTIIIIAFGTNDITGRTTPEQAEASLASAIEAMQNAGVDVFLIGSQVNRAPQARLDAYARMYRRLEQRYEIPLVLDILEPVSNKPSLIRNDNIHPTEAGQVAIAKMLYEPLKAALRDTLAKAERSGDNH
jgi:acyl-CoA thioesterase-1